MNYKGIVIKGNEKGRTLGYPTVNIPLTDSELSGIYAGVVIFDGHTNQAAIFADSYRKVLEAHMLNFDGDLYGKEIEIELKKKLRDSMRFDSVDLLRDAISKDVEDVRAYFKI